MVLAGTRRKARRLALCHSSLVSVELEQLIGTFAHLALWIKHEASTERIDLGVKGNGAMALTALYWLSACVGDALPDHLVTVDLAAKNLTTGIIIEAADEVHTVADGGQGGALTWSWLLEALKWNAYL